MRVDCDSLLLVHEPHLHCNVSILLDLFLDRSFEFIMRVFDLLCARHLKLWRREPEYEESNWSFYYRPAYFPAGCIRRVGQQSRRWQDAACACLNSVGNERVWSASCQWNTRRDRQQSQANDQAGKP